MLASLCPSDCSPPHGVSRDEFVVQLANVFTSDGWDYRKPALVGYPWLDGVQLLSGSHRWAAAVMAELETIPVVVISFAEVRKAWGTDAWYALMRLGELMAGAAHSAREY